MTTTSGRFSLLLLEPGEVYFEDASSRFSLSDIKPGAVPKDDGSFLKGRLKLCSKSLVFDPKNPQAPLLRIPFRNVTSLSSDNSVLLICSRCFIEMIPKGILAPFATKRGDFSFRFELFFRSAEEFALRASQLWRASTLTASQHESMVQAIIFSLQSRVTFDLSWVSDLHEEIVGEFIGKRISHLAVNPGRILLTSRRIYFQPFNNLEKAPVLQVNLESVTAVLRRRCGLRPLGLEVVADVPDDRASLFFSLPSEMAREELVGALCSRIHSQRSPLSEMTAKWQRREVDNFEYLVYLNEESGRSCQDLSQYPVFPWVLSNYTSESLDLNDPCVYRDLRKPLGALNPKRLAELQERFNEMPEPRFLYGSHYSAPAFVVFYLVRKDPLEALCLQGGKFDAPDRMFNSVQEAWSNVNTSPSDFKELIPEFFIPENNGDFLVNSLGIDFGVRQDGKGPVGDVELPPWARGSPSAFVRLNREALEHDIVSANLHHWIDLIFGYKQRGPEAEAVLNIFHPMSYEGYCTTEDRLMDPDELLALRTQISEFGQVPSQLFHLPHPARGFTHRSFDLATVEAPPGGNESTEGSSLLSSADGTVFTVDKLSTIQIVACFTLNKRAISSLSFLTAFPSPLTSSTSPTATSAVLATSEDGSFKLIALRDAGCEVIRSASLPSGLALSDSAALPDGKHVVIGSLDDNVYLYNLELGLVRGSLSNHPSAVSAVAWVDGFLASGSWDGLIRLYPCLPAFDWRVKEPLFEWELPEGKVTAIRIHPASHCLVASSDDQLIAAWNILTGSLQAEIQVGSDVVGLEFYSPKKEDGDRILVVSAEGCASVILKTSGETERKWNLDCVPSCMFWDPVTQVLAVGSSSGHVSIFLQDAPITKVPSMHEGFVSSIGILGRFLVSGGSDGSIQVWR